MSTEVSFYTTSFHPKSLPDERVKKTHEISDLIEKLSKKTNEFALTCLNNTEISSQILQIIFRYAIIEKETSATEVRTTLALLNQLNRPESSTIKNYVNGCALIKAIELQDQTLIHELIGSDTYLVGSDTYLGYGLVTALGKSDTETVAVILNYPNALKIASDSLGDALITAIEKKNHAAIALIQRLPNAKNIQKKSARGCSDIFTALKAAACAKDLKVFCVLLNFYHSKDKLNILNDVNVAMQTQGNHWVRTNLSTIKNSTDTTLDVSECSSTPVLLTALPQREPPKSPAISRPATTATPTRGHLKYLLWGFLALVWVINCYLAYRFLVPFVLKKLGKKSLKDCFTGLKGIYLGNHASGSSSTQPLVLTNVPKLEVSQNPMIVITNTNPPKPPVLPKVLP